MNQKQIKPHNTLQVNIVLKRTVALMNGGANSNPRHSSAARVDERLKHSKRYLTTRSYGGWLICLHKFVWLNQIFRAVVETDWFFENLSPTYL